MLYIIIPCFIILVLLAIFSNTIRPYTHHEWDEQCKSDFKKYGPVPDDIDESN